MFNKTPENGSLRAVDIDSLHDAAGNRISYEDWQAAEVAKRGLAYVDRRPLVSPSLGMSDELRRQFIDGLQPVAEQYYRLLEK